MEMALNLKAVALQLGAGVAIVIGAVLLNLYLKARASR